MAGVVKIVAGGLVVKDGKFVIVREKKNGIAGLWNFPLGGLEEGEKITDCAKREIEEETGLEVRLDYLVGVYQNPKRPNGDCVVKFIFHATPLSGTLTCPPDLQEVKWVSFKEFKEIPASQQRESVNELVVADYLSGAKYPLDFLKAYS